MTINADENMFEEDDLLYKPCGSSNVAVKVAMNIVDCITFGLFFLMTNKKPGILITDTS